MSPFQVTLLRLSVVAQDVDNAALARLGLERKVELLQEEMNFLKELHDEVSIPFFSFFFAGKAETHCCTDVALPAVLKAALRKAKSLEICVNLLKLVEFRSK